MRGDTTIEAVLRRDRAIVLAGLVATASLAWVWVLIGAGTGMSTFAMTTWSFPPPVMGAGASAGAWSPGYWLIMLAMWWVMMIAMMVPSAAPMILLYARVTRHAQARGQIAPTAVPTLAFATGYLLAWLGFSVAATTLQWMLQRVGLVHTMTMWSTSFTLTGGLLMAAGLYQLTPLKHACLEHCRSPAEFLSRHWRPGRSGALGMGAAHGAYCLGCCWFLMALLFAGGIMNLVWIAGLAILVLAEKVAPLGHWLARTSGIAMIAASIYVLLVA